MKTKRSKNTFGCSKGRNAKIGTDYMLLLPIPEPLSFKVTSNANAHGILDKVVSNMRVGNFGIIDPGCIKLFMADTKKYAYPV